MRPSCYYQTASCQPINYRQFVPQIQTFNGAVGSFRRSKCFIQNKTLIYIFLLQKIKIIPDKQFDQILKKVHTSLVQHSYLGSERRVGAD